jgi:lysophospholipase
LNLVATPDNPIPRQPVLARVESAGGAALRVARWRPSARKARGTVLLLQGRAEFIEKYFETVTELRRRGFHVVTFDWRGQGGSDRELPNARKGHVDDFSFYVADLKAVMDEVVTRHCPKPYFCLAHSMGAAILFQALAAGTVTFERCVALAPMLKIDFVKAPRAARLLAEVLDGLGFGASFIPGGGETSISTKPFAGNRLSSDPARYARNAAIAAEAPHLAVGDPTIAWIDAAFRCMDMLNNPRFPAALTAPVLVLAAALDPVVSTPAVERFAARLRSGPAIVIPGARHEMLMERDGVREAFWAAFDAYIPGSRIEEPQETPQELPDEAPAAAEAAQSVSA